MRRNDEGRRSVASTGPNADSRLESSVSFRLIIIRDSSSVLDETEFANKQQLIEQGSMAIKFIDIDETCFAMFFF